MTPNRRSPHCDSSPSWEGSAKIAPENAADQITCVVSRNPSIRQALDEIKRATKGDFYVVGGFVRDALLGGPLGGDIDVMVENGDERIHERFAKLRIPFHLNRHNIRQYRYSGVNIDVYQPRQFQVGFETVLEAICFHDLRINGVVLHVGRNAVIDPIDGLSHMKRWETGLNMARWESARVPLSEKIVLAVRVIGLMEKYPRLWLRDHEVAHIGRAIEAIVQSTWTPIAYRYHGSLDDFHQSATQLMRERILSYAVHA